MRILPVLLLILPLAACGPAYRSSTHIPGLLPTAGYAESNGPGQLIKVTYTGRLGLRMHMASVYSLFRSAEIARRENKPYFALYQTLPDALQDKRGERTVASTVLGNPYSYAYIELHALPGAGLLNADEVIARLEPEVRAEDGK